MTDNKEHMLDLCFEIEGLLALMLKRENDVPETVESLLKQKITELSRLSGLCQCVAENDASSAIAQSAEFEEQEDSEGSYEIAEPDSESVAEHAEDIQAEDIEETEQPIEEETPASNGIAPISLTLNDKFRFRRELFGNNAAELSDALDVVNAVSSQAELDDYFYNDLCWDPENPDVKDFMALASARFNK